MPLKGANASMIKKKEKKKKNPPEPDQLTSNLPVVRVILGERIPDGHVEHKQKCPGGDPCGGVGKCG